MPIKDVVLYTPNKPELYFEKAQHGTMSVLNNFMKLVYVNANVSVILLYNALKPCTASTITYIISILISNCLLLNPRRHLIP